MREGPAVLRGALSAVGRAPPRHEKELEGFLGCGDPGDGFVWLHCAGRDHRWVALHTEDIDRLVVRIAEACEA